MSKKKKIIILSSMILLLVVTAVFNFVFSGSGVISDATITTSYFSEYKAQRSSSRNEQILQLDKIILESGEDSAVKETALIQKMQLTALTEQELRLESLIKAYGYEEVVVTMNLSSPNVNVVVKDSE